MGPIEVMNISIILLFSLIWLGAVLFLRLKKEKSFAYLLLFTIFFIYIFKVLDYTLLQFQLLLLLKHFMPNLMLNGQAASESLNFIPLVTLGIEDAKTSLLNILLFIPCGFGLPFITHLRLKEIVITGMLFSIGIECLQFITGVMAKITFRIADINDVIINTIGTLIGYLLFVGFIRIYPRIAHHLKVLEPGGG